MIRLECGCGRTADLPDSMAGRKGQCSGCGKVIVIPPPGGAKKKLGPQVQPKNPGVGLDKECERCDGIVSYAFKGPIPGLCGKCTDREMAERRRRARGRKVKRMVGGFEVEDWIESRLPWKTAILGILVLFLAGLAFVLWKSGVLHLPG